MQRWKTSSIIGSDVDDLAFLKERNPTARKPPTITENAIGRFEARSRGLLCEGFGGWGVGTGELLRLVLMGLSMEDANR
jgi:hypothetical protein